MSYATARKGKAVLLIAMLMVAETRRIKHDIRLSMAFSRNESNKHEKLQKSWVPQTSSGNDTLSSGSYNDFYDATDTIVDGHAFYDTLNFTLHPLRSEEESLTDATHTADVAEYLLKVKFPTMMDEFAADASVEDKMKWSKCFSSTQPLILGLIQHIRSAEMNTIKTVAGSFAKILANSDCAFDVDQMDQTESERTISTYGETLKKESLVESLELTKQIEIDIAEVCANSDQCNLDKLTSSWQASKAPMNNDTGQVFLETHSFKTSGVINDFASLFSPAEGRKDLCPLFHLFRYFVENSIAAVYGHYGGTEAEKDIIRALIGNQLEYLCPAINTGHAILKSVYTAGVPAMLGYGDVNVLAFIAMEVAILYFFVLLMVVGKVSLLQSLWDKFIVGPLANTNKFLQTMASPETHIIPRLAATLGSVVTGSGQAVLYALPRLGVGVLSVLMSVLMAMRAVIFGSQLGAGVAAYVAAMAAEAASQSGWEKLAGGLMGFVGW